MTGEVSAYFSSTETENCTLLFPGTLVVSMPVPYVQLPQQKILQGNSERRGEISHCSELQPAF